MLCPVWHFPTFFMYFYIASQLLFSFGINTVARPIFTYSYRCFLLLTGISILHKLLFNFETIRCGTQLIIALQITVNFLGWFDLSRSFYLSNYAYNVILNFRTVTTKVLDYYCKREVSDIKSTVFATSVLLTFHKPLFNMMNNIYFLFKTIFI